MVLLQAQVHPGGSRPHVASNHCPACQVSQAPPDVLVLLASFRSLAAMLPPSFPPSGSEALLSALFQMEFSTGACRLGARVQLCGCQLAELFPHSCSVNTNSCYQSHGSNLAEPDVLQEGLCPSGLCAGAGPSQLVRCVWPWAGRWFLPWPMSEVPFGSGKKPEL